MAVNTPTGRLLAVRGSDAPCTSNYGHARLDDHTEDRDTSTRPTATREHADLRGRLDGTAQPTERSGERTPPRPEEADSDAVVAAWLELRDAVRRSPTVPCRVDAEAWFAPDSGTRAIAARACAPCPVRGLCGAYADLAGERFGVWGGLDRERRDRGRRTA